MRFTHPHLMSGNSGRLWVSKLKNAHQGSKADGELRRAAVFRLRAERVHDQAPHEIIGL
jgi:hypothetical protein